MENLEQKFDAPIPGMGMTAELGGRPWQSPPQYPTVEGAIDYYITRLSVDEFSDQIVDILEMGVPVSTLVNIIQTSGAMQGIHTIDVGILIAPVLMEFVMFLGDSAGIEYTVGDEDTDEPSKAMLNSALNKFKKAEKNSATQEQESNLEDKIDSVAAVPVEEKQPTSLMARRS